MLNFLRKKTNPDKQLQLLRPVWEISKAARAAVMGLSMVMLLPEVTVAQTISSYAFSQSAGTYTPIAGTVVATATSASGAGSLDDINYTVALPFSFAYAGTVYASGTNITINTNGYITFGSAPATNNYIPISSTATYAGAVAAIALDLNALFDINGLTGNIRTATVGTGASQELVIQYSNFRPYNTSASTTTYWNWNFQIRLGADNNIRFVYDFNVVGSPTGGSGQVGLRGASNAILTSVKNRLVNTANPWSSSAPGTTNASTATFSTTLLPSSGLTYTFTAPPPPSCPAPSLVAAANTSNTSSQISFNSNGGGGTFIVEYGLNSNTNAFGSGATAGTGYSVVTTAASPVTLTGLTTGATYKIVVRQDCGANGFSTNSSPVLITPGVILLSNSAVTTCEGTFYDTGGASGSYTNNEDFTQTFTPATAGQMLQFNFTSFATESCCDRLRIYNGPNTSSPLLSPVDGFVGTNSPGLITANNPTGQLTFRFTSDGSTVAAGWAAAISCVAPQTCSAPSGVTITNTTTTSANVTFTASVTAGATYIVEYGPSGFTAGTGASAGSAGSQVVTGAGSPVALTGLTQGTAYQVYVRSNCGANGFSANASVVAFATVPTNDLCSNAIPVTCGNSYTGTNIGATSTGQPTATCTTAPGSFGVWYKFIGDGSLVTANTCTGSNFDTKLNVYTGSCGTFTCVTGNDDFCSNQSQVTFTSVVGTTYYILVTGFGTATGNFGLALSCITCIAPTAVTTSNITANSVQVNFTPNGAGTFIVEYGPSSFTSPGTGATAGTGGTVVSGNAGSPVVITGLNSSTAYRFYVRKDCGTNSFSANSTVATATTTPTNDLCSNAILVTCGNSYSGTNLGASSTGQPTASCITAPGSAGVWYTFVGDGSQVTANTCTGTAFDTKLNVYTGSCGTFTCVTGNDDFCSTQSSVTFNSVSGTTYYILVTSFGTTTGNFGLAINCTSCPAPTAVSASNITSTSVQVGFTNNGGGGTYIVEYGPSATFITPGTGATAGTGGTVITNNAASPVIVSGLSSSTQYRFFVRQECAGGTFSSNSTSITATTLVACPAPSAVTTNNITSTSVQVNFTPNGTGSFIVEYGLSTFTTPGTGATAGTGGTVVSGNAGSPVVITGLNSATAYRFYVRKNCGPDGFSLNSTVATGTTTPFNDDCANATPLAVNSFGACASTAGTVAGATQSIAPVACGGLTSSAANDVWYSFAATHNAHSITFTPTVNSGFDAVLNLRSGACNGVNLACADATSSGPEVINATGLTIGATYLVRVYHYGTIATNPGFGICVTAPNCATLASSISAQTSAGCTTGGSATVTATGGTAPYSYSWNTSPVQTTATATGLAAGSYLVTVKDANGCTTTSSVTISQTGSVTASAGSNSPVTSGNTITLTATGGTSYTWSGPNGFSSGLQNPEILNASSANQGVYVVTATTGVCTSTASVNVMVINAIGSCLSGNYTINPAIATGGTNFQSIAQMAASLNTVGVCGAVTITFAPGIYTTPLVLDQIPGSSTANVVTINGAGITYNACANLAIILLNGTDNVTLTNFTLNASCDVLGFLLRNGTENVTLSGNTVNLLPTALSTNKSIAILVDAPTGSVSLLNNTIRNGFVGIWARDSNAPVKVEGNKLYNAYGYGILLQNLMANRNPAVANSGVLVNSNRVRMRNAAHPNAQGIRANYIGGGFMMNSNFINRSPLMAINLANANQTGAVRAEVINNRMGGDAQNSSGGIGIYNADNLDLLHNSIVGQTRILLSENLDVRNNSFVSVSANEFAFFGTPYSNSYLALNHNYYANTTGGKFVGIETEYLNMAQLQQGYQGVVTYNQNSIGGMGYPYQDSLRITSASLLYNAGVMAGVTVDFEGQARPQAGVVDIGADEYMNPVSPPRFAAATLDAEVYPNPFHNKLTVRVTSAEAGNVQMVLSDLMGRQVLSRSYTAEAGTKTAELQVVEQLSQGVYLLQVTQGEATSTFRVIKQ